MSGPHIQDMQLSSIAVLLSLLDECRTEEELRSVCARISPLLREQEDRGQLVATFHCLKGGIKGYGKGSQGNDEGKDKGKGHGKGEASDEKDKGKGNNTDSNDSDSKGSGEVQLDLIAVGSGSTP